MQPKRQEIRPFAYLSINWRKDLRQRRDLPTMTTTCSIIIKPKFQLFLYIIFLNGNFVTKTICINHINNNLVIKKLLIFITSINFFFNSLLFKIFITILFTISYMDCNKTNSQNSFSWVTEEPYSSGDFHKFVGFPIFKLPFTEFALFDLLYIRNLLIFSK